MSAKSRLLLVLALPVFALAGIAEVRAQHNWSDPATWPDGQVPGEWDAVVISEGMDVVLDVSPPALRSLTIDGRLTFSDELDLELVTEWIVLHGELTIGTEDNRHTRNATIIFTDEVPGEDIMAGMGDRGIMISGGTLNLHGARTNAWTKLAETAEAGSTTIEVLNADQWRVGDQIVLASTDFDPRQAERRTIAAISGNRITLDEPLEYMHFGQITFDVDQRGEVGLLTRNIRIQASADAEESYFGGHIMAMPGSEMYVDGVELTRMGQHLTLARYPIHWHLIGDAEGQYIRNSAIHDTFNRCVTVHGTNDLQVENNVTYNTVGHCFFMEDGIETGNRFVRNLAIQTKCHPTLPCDPTNLAPFGTTSDGMNFKTTGQDSNDVLIPSDNTVASFWITNPDNVYLDNVAAGSDAIGFWFAFPEHPTGAFEGTAISRATWPRRTRVREFKGNTAHSNFDGLMYDRGPGPDGRFGQGGYVPLADPSDANSAQVETLFEDFTSYKNRNGGMWARGELNVFKGLKLADNAIGFTHASGNLGAAPYTSRVVDSLFVGETENVGNPRTPAERAYGRSLPFPEVADFPIRGYEFYDFRHHVDNVTFVNFEDNDTRKTGAISYLLYTSFGMSSNNSVERATFTNAKPVYFPPLEHRWSNDDYGNGSYMTSVFHDKDGSVGGVPNSYILINEGIAIDEACEIKPTWNAAVCTGDIGRMNVGGDSSVINFGGGGRRAAALAGDPVAPAQPPVILSRNGNDFPSHGATNVRAGTEIKVTTERPSIPISVTELDAGSWVIFELPGFTTADSGTAVDSLDALRTASATSYYKGDGSLWVKLVSNGDFPGAAGRRPSGGARLQVSR